MFYLRKIKHQNLKALKKSLLTVMYIPGLPVIVTSYYCYLSVTKRASNRRHIPLMNSDWMSIDNQFLSIMRDISLVAAVCAVVLKHVHLHHSKHVTRLPANHKTCPTKTFLQEL